jgi:hypothetical protein
VSDSGVGRELKPVKFDVNKFRRSQVNRDSNRNTPDQFGQTYNADYDQSKWTREAPQESRRAHSRSDVDSGPRSLHHTLGPKHNQASPGDHIHDGITSKKIGPMEMDPANPGLTRPEWTIPATPNVADLVTLLGKFVNFRQV